MPIWLSDLFGRLQVEIGGVFVSNCGSVLQWDEEFMFDAATVRRMERVLLDALEWRTRSVTPFAFLGFFLSACYPPLRHAPQVAAIKARAVNLLFRSQPGTNARMPSRPLPMHTVPWHSSPAYDSSSGLKHWRSGSFGRSEDGGVLALHRGRGSASRRHWRHRRRELPRVPCRHRRLSLCKQREYMFMHSQSLFSLNPS
jgi:hypothetical protein